jgi:hypothetical protein
MTTKFPIYLPGYLAGIVLRVSVNDFKYKFKKLGSEKFLLNME